MSRQRRGPALAVAGLTLFLSLLNCKGGDHGSGGDGGPPGAQGAPPGRDGPGAPGAPVGPGGHGNQHGGAPGAPYHIPATVLLDPNTVIDSASWPGIEKMFWDACAGGTHCVDPRLVPVAKAGKAPCQFDHVSPGVGTGVRLHTVINVYVGAPCPPDGTTGDSVPPESPDSVPPPPPVSEPPSTP